MAERTQQARKAPKKKKEPEEVEEPAKREKTGIATLDVANDWLSEIDDILEENDAAEFVRSYVQKGGE